jgi:hypothetical protein
MRTRSPLTSIADEKAASASVSATIRPSESVTLIAKLRPKKSLRRISLALPPSIVTPLPAANPLTSRMRLRLPPSTTTSKPQPGSFPLRTVRSS